MQTSNEKINNLFAKLTIATFAIYIILFIINFKVTTFVALPFCVFVLLILSLFIPNKLLTLKTLILICSSVMMLYLTFKLREDISMTVIKSITTLLLFSHMALTNHLRIVQKYTLKIDKVKKEVEND